MLLIRITVSLFLFFTLSVNAVELKPQEFTDTTIVEQIGSLIDSNVNLISDTGNTVSFSELLGENSIVLSFVYYSCPKLCHLVTRGLVKSVNQLPSDILENSHLITVSFDHRDTMQSTVDFKNKYSDKLNNKDLVEWDFFYSSPDQVKLLTDSIGYKFKFNENTQEYAHSMAIIVLTKEGIVSRYLYGIDYDPFDLKLALIESGKGKSGKSFYESVLMYCFSYNPDERGYVVEAVLLVKIVGIMTLLGITFFIFRLTRSSN